MLKRYRRKNRSASLLHAHLVFCSKFRRKVFTPAVFAALRASMETTARDLGVDIIAIEADRDHVHLMVAFPPKLALSDLVRRMKGASPRAIRTRRFPEVLRALWGKHFWSPSYFASFVSQRSTGALRPLRGPPRTLRRRTPRSG